MHPRFEPKDWSNVEIEAGKTTTLAWNFQTSAAGSVRIVLTGGWAHVYVDGVEHSRTAPCLIENLPAGKHTIELKRVGFQIEGSPMTVTIKPGTTIEAAFQLKQSP